VGGLSVWREIRAQLPSEDTIYVADQAHIPYGPRPPEEIRRYAVAIAALLIELHVKVIVVACNTASGAALQTLRATFPGVPFVGMEPAVKPAAEQTKSGVVGVIATPTTFEGEPFRRLADRFGQDVSIHTRTCPGLVELIEAGSVGTTETRSLLRDCLDPLLALGIDELVLGCTHYPFARDLIAGIVGPDVAIIDPAPAVARQVRRVLASSGLLSSASEPGEHRFLTSGPPTRLVGMVQQLIGVAAHAEGAIWQEGRLRIG
jgi:glutamate racemase